MRILALAALFLVTLGCTAPPSTPSPSLAVFDDVRVSETGPISSDCPLASVYKAVRDYISAFNASDTQKLTAIFEHGVLFTAWNPAPRGFFSASGLQDLLDYVAERHAQHESLRLTSLTIQYGTERIGLAPSLERRADDIVTETSITKAELDCRSHALTAWNQGGWARSPASTPIGFDLPSGCRIVGDADLRPESTQWRIDCGQSANRDLRSALEPALLQQGWRACARAPKPAWQKPRARVLLTADATTPSELPRLIEQFQTPENCPA